MFAPKALSIVYRIQSYVPFKYINMLTNKLINNVMAVIFKQVLFCSIDLAQRRYRIVEVRRHRVAEFMLHTFQGKELAAKLAFNRS